MPGVNDAQAGATSGVDFFVSYAGPDRPWAQWVAAQLEAVGYRVELDVWDWSTGDNFVLRMNDALERAEWVVSLWSPAYFERERFTTPEWTAVLAEQTRRADGTTSARRPRLIPLRVVKADPPPILHPYLYRDLFGLNEEQARAELLAAVDGPSGRDAEHEFPGGWWAGRDAGAGWVAAGSGQRAGGVERAGAESDVYRPAVDAGGVARRSDGRWPVAGAGIERYGWGRQNAAGGGVRAPVRR